MPPLVVVEGPAVAHDHAIAELTAAGWTIVGGFAPPMRPGRSVRSGPIAESILRDLGVVAAKVG